MKAHAPTAIWCPARDHRFDWHVTAKTRDAAEHYYQQALATGQYPKPVYRVVIQYRVDQYEDHAPLSIGLH